MKRPDRAPDFRGELREYYFDEMLEFINNTDCYYELIIINNKLKVYYHGRPSDINEFYLDGNLILEAYKKYLINKILKEKLSE